ncbi:OLC1v1005380C1 [Oldenlandia corymbosa var. corymbosa]|uniref:OLC1v1005380C1 n=1 Tax=Oldenlandia corymbosa var. corymbosa TaxID=529605 RepID=A0AAV1DGV3_OLDCO|nr:OLC1v1005380C1 [Oldenlandia corymbosa var. corymbosa]
MMATDARSETAAGMNGIASNEEEFSTTIVAAICQYSNPAAPSELEMGITLAADGRGTKTDKVTGQTIITYKNYVKLYTLSNQLVVGFAGRTGPATCLLQGMHGAGIQTVSAPRAWLATELATNIDPTSPSFKKVRILLAGFTNSVADVFWVEYNGISHSITALTKNIGAVGAIGDGKIPVEVAAIGKFDTEISHAEACYMVMDACFYTTKNDKLTGGYATGVCLGSNTALFTFKSLQMVDYMPQRNIQGNLKLPDGNNLTQSPKFLDPRFIVPYL